MAATRADHAFVALLDMCPVREMEHAVGWFRAAPPPSCAPPARPRGSNRSQGENVTPVGASSDGRYITGNKLSEDTQNREEEGGERVDGGFRRRVYRGWHKFSMEYCEPVKGDGTFL